MAVRGQGKFRLWIVVCDEMWNKNDDIAIMLRKQGLPWRKGVLHTFVYEQHQSPGASSWIVCR